MTAILTSEASARDLRALALDDLAGLYESGSDDDRAAILAECERRDRADRSRKARQAAESAWIDGAFAQYLAAENDCRGSLFSRKGEAEGVADAFSLWRGSDRWAMTRASEELRNWWDAHGGRLSLASWRRQQAMAARAARDERDLADGTASPPRKRQPEPECPWQRVPGGAVRPATVQVGSLSVAAVAAMDAAGATTLHPSRRRAEQWLAPEPEPAPVPPAGPAVAPGAVRRYSAALATLTSQVDALTAHVLAARGRLTEGNKR